MAEASSDGCPTSHLYIPNLSGDGVTSLPIPTSTEAFISHHCGSVLGIDATDVSLALVCKSRNHMNEYFLKLIFSGYETICYRSVLGCSDGSDSPNYRVLT